jgi:serine/threonine protein kinase
LAEHPRYEILGLIGKGGMGDVYKARHRMMERTVALKIIKRELVRGNPKPWIAFIAK